MALADERITDAIRMVCENELFSDGHLLSVLRYLPSLIYELILQVFIIETNYFVVYVCVVVR